MNSKHWQTLELEPTDDLKLVKSSYARLIKSYRPHEHPEQFKAIRAAYEAIKLSLENAEEPPRIANLHNKKSTLSDKERLFIALDELMAVYDDLENRNVVAAWNKALSNTDLILYSEDIMDTGHSFLREILKYEYLHITEMPLNINVYIVLFDFFKLNEQSYLLGNYHAQIAEPLVARIRERRFAILEKATSISKLNLYVPAYQVTAEIFLAEEIIPFNSTELFERQALLNDRVSKHTSDENTVIRRIIFKHILDNYLRAEVNQEQLTIGLLYKICKFANNKRSFRKIFSALNYHQQDIKNCLEFCEKSYRATIQPEPKNIPLIILAIMVGLISQSNKIKNLFI